MNTRPIIISIATALALLALSTTASAQYNTIAGQNAPTPAAQPEAAGSDAFDEVGEKRSERPRTAGKVQRDAFGNANGSDYDLAVDGAFKGQTVVVLQLHQTAIEEPWKVLRQKGFSVYRFRGVPSPKQLADALARANQFWLISGCRGQVLTQAHANHVKKFFDSGRGVYIWGDNDPCYGDANLVSRTIFDTGMTGNLQGDKTIGIKGGDSKGGVLADHLLSTGIEFIYEGITIATIDPNPLLQPFIWGSANNVVAGLHDKQGKRAIVDGGFTRLFYKWNTAGTGRYIANAAAWLANVERFGDDVVAEGFKESASQRKAGP